MLKNHIITLSILLFLLPNAFAQNADIRGQVVEKNQPLYGAYVELKKDNIRVKALVASDSGVFILSDLVSGQYTLHVSAEGYHTYKEAIYLQPMQSVYKKVALLPSTSELAELVVRGGIRIEDGVKPPTGKEIEEGPYNSPLDFIANDPALIKRGEKIQVSIARPEQLVIIKDNMSQIGPLLPVTMSLGQVRVVSVGVPATYGDFVGGAIEYTSSHYLDTKSRHKFMLRSSSPFNAYNQNALESFWYKPLNVVNYKTKLALTHSLFASYSKDPSPTAVQLHQLEEGIKSELLLEPFVKTREGLYVSTPNGYLSNDFKKIDAKQHAASKNVYSSIRLEWKPNEDLFFKLEPSFQFVQNQQFSFANSLLNSEHNPLRTSITGKLNGEMSHTILKPYNSKGELTYDNSWISKLGYRLILDYQRVNSSTKDPIHQDNVFAYGHVGKFTRRGQDAYTFVPDVRIVRDQYGKEQVVQGYFEWNGFETTELDFVPSTTNTHKAAITNAAMASGLVTNFSELSQELGLLNGQNPNAINGMWYAPGTVVSNYSKSDRQKASVSAIINMSINPRGKLGEQHDIQLGSLFEQQTRSYYSLRANALWQLMPQLVNNQFIVTSHADASLTFDENGMFTDTLNYLYTADQSRQSTFDKSLRKEIGTTHGFQSGGAHFIDIHSIDPSQLSVDFFSANELWNNGNGYVNYAGYDHKGNLQRKARSIQDFILDRDNRHIAGYTPHYSALWLQDKFVLEKIKIRAGLRIERFDANQRVLRDEYSLYPIKTIREVDQINGQSTAHPSTLSHNAAVYVDDMHSPTQVVGYRQGKRWYDQNGTQLSSAEYLRVQTTNGVIQPLLQDPENQELNSLSFQDFDPKTMVLPRLSLSFPISTTALFYAYYDKFAQRPNFAQSFTPISTYYYLENASNTILPNPALKAAKRTDYQFGYKQLLGDRGILNLRAGYADIRDDINLVSIEQAYPRSYITYGNVDFSTVKSFGADYQVSFPSIMFKANYLLQFADGTGSNANSAASLIQVGQPNLKSLYPLEYDIRHKVNVNVNLKLDSLALGKSKVFKNMKISLFANALSGTPYTALVSAIPEAQNLGTVSRSQIKEIHLVLECRGIITVDMSVSKMVAIHRQPFVFQLNMVNLLNIMNVYNVYSYSSSATNDGFLASPQGQQQVRNELNAQSFVNYYSLKQKNPSNFGAPRMVSLTIRTAF